MRGPSGRVWCVFSCVPHEDEARCLAEDGRQSKCPLGGSKLFVVGVPSRRTGPRQSAKEAEASRPLDFAAPTRTGRVAVRVGAARCCHTNRGVSPTSSTPASDLMVPHNQLAISGGSGRNPSVLMETLIDGGSAAASHRLHPTQQ